jgi:hypothetical protein
MAGIWRQEDRDAFIGNGRLKNGVGNWRKRESIDGKEVVARLTK